MTTKNKKDRSKFTHAVLRIKEIGRIFKVVLARICKNDYDPAPSDHRVCDPKLLDRSVCILKLSRRTGYIYTTKESVCQS